MYQTQMSTCQYCGGAKFYGTGSIGWGGKICYCNANITPPPAQHVIITHSSDPALLRIEALLTKLLAKMEAAP